MIINTESGVQIRGDLIEKATLRNGLYPIPVTLEAVITADDSLAAQLKQKPLVELKPKPRLTNVQRMQLVLKTIDEEIRPQLASDGGDIELVDVDGLRIVVALKGRCAHCRSSEVTIRDLVQRLLREHVEADIVVEEA